MKFGQFEFDKGKIEQLKKEDITYNPYRAQLSYQPDVCIWAASRPMDNRTYTYLRKSGHLYRYHVLRHEISDTEAERFFEEDFYPDISLQEKLADLNGRLVKIKVKELKMPNKYVLGNIRSQLEDIVKDEVAIERQRLAEIIDLRTKGDVIREITAHAFLRTAIETDFKDAERLEYTGADVEFILRRISHFVEFKINPLYVDEFIERRQRKKRPRDQVKELVREFLSNGEIRQRKEIDDYVNSQIKVGNATISNALEDLLSEHEICQPKYGFYKSKEE